MRRIRRRLAGQLRTWADRLDHYGAMKVTGWSFTLERGRGIVFRDDRRGCRVMYLGDDEYARAHAEADDPM